MKSIAHLDPGAPRRALRRARGARRAGMDDRRRSGAVRRRRFARADVRGQPGGSRLRRGGRRWLNCAHADANSSCYEFIRIPRRGAQPIQHASSPRLQPCGGLRVPVASYATGTLCFCAPESARTGMRSATTRAPRKPRIEPRTGGAPGRGSESARESLNISFKINNLMAFTLPYTTPIFRVTPVARFSHFSAHPIRKVSAWPKRPASSAESDAASADYDAESIKVLKGLDAVRKRPGMYIGDTDDGSGLHHMVYEVVDNAIDEALAGHATQVTVTLNPDGSCTVLRRRPRHPDRHPQGRGRVGRRSDHDPAPCGREIRPELLQGVGRPARRRRLGGQRALDLAASCAIWRDGKEHFMEFAHGDAVAPLAVVGDAGGKRGTEVTFLPSTRDLHDGGVRFRDARSIACASSRSSIPASPSCSPTSVTRSRSARSCATRAASRRS